MINKRDRTAVAVNHVVPHAESSHGRALDRRRSIRGSLLRISQGFVVISYCDCNGKLYWMLLGFPRPDLAPP